MKMIRGLKSNNRGASLIAVLIAIVVVGVMGSVVMQLTITNLQMKEVERQGKKNFYSAEDFMGYLTNQINVKSAKQLQEAFNDMLAMYKTVSQSEVGLKQAFSKAYLDRMIAAFGADSPNPSQKKVDEQVVYEVGYYKLSSITSLIYDAVNAGVNDVVPVDLKTLPADGGKYGFSFTAHATETDCGVNCFYYADYANGTFTLSNVCVHAEDDFGNVTKVQTDLVFHTPDINLDGSNMVKEFMRYSLIADKQIVLTTDNVTVDGNVYAGKDGILCNLDKSGKFIGKKIVTRGDIATYSSSSNTKVLQIGNPDNASYSQIWARNYKTLSGGTGAKLYVSGDSYIADDLCVDGNDSVVLLNGAYYGYNFQENYDSVAATNDSSYSSAFMINGKNAMIDVNDLTSLMIYGRTFIGRNKNVSSGANDILMGETISVKSNQIAYYVPNDCVVSGVLNLDAYENYSGVANVDQYVTGNGVTEYHYKDRDGNEVTAYYLKFQSDQAANNFYYEYFNSKQISMMEKAKRYVSTTPRTVTINLDGGGTTTVDHYSLQIRTSNNAVMRGDYLFSDGAGNLVTAKWNIPGGYWGQGETYFEFAKDHAIRYKSLVLTLEDKNDSSMAGNVRLQDTDPTLYHNLIDDAQWAGFFTDHASELTDGTKFEKSWKERESDEDSGILLALVNNADGVVYPIPDSIAGKAVVGGLVIASGDVKVSKNFKGTIISGGTIDLDGASAVIESDEVLISKMISQDAMLRSNALFAKLFKGYSESAEEIMSGSSIEKYMTFDNWTKTIE